MRLTCFITDSMLFEQYVAEILSMLLVFIVLYHGHQVNAKYAKYPCCGVHASDYASTSSDDDFPSSSDEDPCSDSEEPPANPISLKAIVSPMGSITLVTFP